MKKTSFMYLLAASLGFPVFLLGGQAKLTHQLQLTTEVIDTKFCNSDYLRLKLRLRYVNSGDQPIILYRQSNTIMTYFISKSIGDAALEKYEQKYSPLQSQVNAAELVDSKTVDEQTFVILKPSASYEVLTNADLPFIFDGTNQDSDLLRPGHHVLQIRVQTWSAPPKVATRLRERWRSYGQLWTQSLVSAPMKFSVAKSPNVVPCSTNED